MSNARQIYVTAQTMALDHVSTGKPYLGWPGDLRKHSQIRNTTDFVKLVVKLDYIKEGHIRVFGTKEVKPVTKLADFKVIPNSAESSCGFKIFAVTEENPAETILITTANFEDFHKPLSPKAIPFGDKRFVVFRKGGDGNVYKKTQTAPEIIGIMPDGTDFEHPGSAAASLLPQE